jgi:F-type H+-transporting ATPase subunit delta
MIYGSISRRYAKALFELGTESGMLSRYVREIELMSNYWSESKELRGAMMSPAIPLKTRRGILDKLAAKFGFCDHVHRFLALLVNRGRIDSIELIHLTLKAMADRKEGVLRGEVTSAFALERDQVDYLVGALEKKTGKKIFVTQHVDAALIGGVVIKMEGVVVNGSIRSSLEEFRKTLRGDIEI